MGEREREKCSGGKIPSFQVVELSLACIFRLSPSAISLKQVPIYASWYRLRFPLATKAALTDSYYGLSYLGPTGSRIINIHRYDRSNRASTQETEVVGDSVKLI